MPKELQYLSESGVVYFKDTSVISINDRFENMDTVLAFCAKHHCTKLLADVRGQHVNTELKEEYSFARAFRTRLKNFRVAVLYDSAEHTFIREFLSDQFGQKLKRFENLDDALTWLANN